MMENSIVPRTGKPMGGHKKRNYTVDQYGVTKQQNKFISEYIKDYCGVKAAVRAGYSEKSARAQASTLLTKPNIQKAITREEAKLQNRFLATKEKILKELAVVGFSDIDDYIEVDDNGKVKIKNLDTLPFAASRAIKSIKEKSKDMRNREDDTLLFRETQLEFTLHDKLEALFKMGKELSMFKDKCEITGTEGEPISVKLEDLSDEQLLAIITRGSSEGTVKD